MSYKRKILITTIFTIRKTRLRSYEEESWIVISKIYANGADCQDGCLRHRMKLWRKGICTWRVMGVSKRKSEKALKETPEGMG